MPADLSGRDGPFRGDGGSDHARILPRNAESGIGGIRLASFRFHYNLGTLKFHQVDRPAGRSRSIRGYSVRPAPRNRSYLRIAVPFGKETRDRNHRTASTEPLPA